jgi:hypothetical protein
MISPNDRRRDRLAPLTNPIVAPITIPPKMAASHVFAALAIDVCVVAMQQAPIASRKRSVNAPVLGMMLVNTIGLRARRLRALGFDHLQLILLEDFEHELSLALLGSAFSD